MSRLSPYFQPEALSLTGGDANLDSIGVCWFPDDSAPGGSRVPSHFMGSSPRLLGEVSIPSLRSRPRLPGRAFREPHQSGALSLTP